MLVRDAFCALSTVLLCLNVNVAEWVDMPQFSDEAKIYRIPSVQHDQFYKFRRGDADSINFPSGQRNGSQTYRYPAEATRVTHNKRTEIKRINSIAMSTTPANLFPDQIADSFADTGTSRTTTVTDTVTENKLNNKNDATISPMEDTMINTLTTQPSPNNKQETSRDKYDNDTSQQDDGIFQYLPIDLLKSVHRTLRSQPGSIEGKLYFLKTFEKTLMSEIGKICSYTLLNFETRKAFSRYLIHRISPYHFYGTESQNKRCRLSRRPRRPFFRIPFDRRHADGHIVSHVRSLPRPISHAASPEYEHAYDHYDRRYSVSRQKKKIHRSR
ncbi:uncharacterized protein [Temnothorax nylanderi]|uniref:uncharacterized protein isoform X2 n=1 Tax=Temnothorax nylanderi TaxID=102681 RepID=UPI003A877F6E